MSETLRRVQTLVLAGDVHPSEHGYDELSKEVITGIATGGLSGSISRP